MNNKQELITLQASLFILQAKIKNFHWNIKGADFFEIHEQLDKLYEDTTEQLDAVAEKLLMLGYNALGSYQEVNKYSLIKEIESKDFVSNEIFTYVVNDLNTLLEYIGEMDNISYRVQPLLDEIVIYLDTWHWKFLKSTK
ncbi:Dps family protein [Mycoplasma sp. VS509_3]|uniref:Dps family protein n=1 Tax=unclassified Mycoplasma TaxID=2683645 RepID=UPI003AACD81C